MSEVHAGGRGKSEEPEKEEPAPEPAPVKAKSKRGFASMDPEKRRAICAKGGASVAPHRRSFSQNSDLASSAGRKGGQSSHGGGRKPAAAE